MTDAEKISEIQRQLELLQENQSFQEQAISDLNQAMFEQQKQILLIQEENRYLARQLELLQQGGSEGETVVDKPPHY